MNARVMAIGVLLIALLATACGGGGGGSVSTDTPLGFIDEGIVGEEDAGVCTSVDEILAGRCVDAIDGSSAPPTVPPDQRVPVTTGGAGSEQSDELAGAAGGADPDGGSVDSGISDMISAITDGLSAIDGDTGGGSAPADDTTAPTTTPPPTSTPPTTTPPGPTTGGSLLRPGARADVRPNSPTTTTTTTPS
jgi:hypothetical protein